MAFKPVLYDLKTAWYNAIAGNLSVSVYKDAVPLTENGAYVVIRSEGSTDTGPTNSGWFRSAIIITEIVIPFRTIGNSVQANTVSQEIDNIILQGITTYGISLPNHQITQISLQSESELYDDDGSQKYFSLIRRYEHFLNQI